MAVYDPSGSHGVHMDASISGKKKQDPAKMPMKKATMKKAMPKKMQQNADEMMATKAAKSKKK